jgi:hypothetical protein
MDRLTLRNPRNPYVKDAEAAGRYAVDFIRAQRRYTRGGSVDFIYWLARWAAHWANKAMQAGIVLLLAALTSGCVLHHRLHVFPACADGLPVQVLVDPACPPDGICGYSCLPGRWTGVKGR